MRLYRGSCLRRLTSWSSTGRSLALWGSKTRPKQAGAGEEEAAILVELVEGPEAESEAVGAEGAEEAGARLRRAAGAG